MKQRIRDIAKRPDPTAAALGAILALCGAFHVPDRLGITADEMGMVLGSIATLAAIARARLQHRAEASA